MEDTRVTLTDGDGETMFEGTSGEFFDATDKVRKALKETPEDAAVRDRAYGVTAAELRQFIERWERLEAEKKDLAEEQKEVMAEAKGRGYDTRAMREVIKLRKLREDERAEREAVLDLYCTALGM